MYKLLIVDDEELEREGMARFIPWADYDIVLADTAWNGVEGLEKIKKYRPEIVMTDIKMPVMNGIELIREAKKEFPDTTFIVLSGYGEYEYTSQAMEEGVRHYILKPCDEEKIVKVIDKVKAEIAEQKRQKEQMAEYSTTIRRLLPRAKEQVFYNLLMGREQIQEDYRLFMEELDENLAVCVLTIRLEMEIDYVIQFVLYNILEELFGGDIFIMATAFSNEMVFLLHAAQSDKVQFAVKRMKTELDRLSGKKVQAALSEEGVLREIRTLYLQTTELLGMGGEKYQEEVLTYGLFREAKQEVGLLVNYEALRNAQDLERVLIELYLASCQMKRLGYSDEKKRGVYQWLQRVFGKGQIAEDGEQSEWELLCETAQFIAGQKTQEAKKGQDEERMERILLAVFAHLTETEMNIRYLAKEVLFMNEDYFGRLFLRYKKVKFSTYVLDLRIELARRIMQDSPDIRVSDVAGMVGFPEDGQYFSKVFRRATGMTPSQYKEANADRYTGGRKD